MRARLLAGLVLVACHGSDSAAVDAQADAAAAPPSALSALARAEDQRSTKDVTDELAHSPDPAVRRRAARALARIADAAAADKLVAALVDDDAEVVAWAAYGAGFTCKGREEQHVKALAARAASLRDEASVTAGGVDARWSIARALGRCGGGAAESTLTGWVKRADEWSDAAALALGDVGARRGKLDEETITELLEAAEKGRSAAFYPFARLDAIDPAFGPRLLAAARATIGGSPGDGRAFAVRALSRAGKDAAQDLARVATTVTFSAPERADAARALARLGDEGRKAAAQALGRVLPSSPNDALDVLRMGGDDYAVAVALLGSIGDRADRETTPMLELATRLKPSSAVPDALSRRLATLRCTAASVLASGAFDAEVLRTCDAPGTVAFERGRLASLVRRPFGAPDRRAAWLALTKSTHAVIVEAALEAIDAHAELGDAAKTALATALADARPGVVATAAERIVAHPERVLSLSPKEIKRALDPSAPPPTTRPEEEADPGVAKALDAALAKTWKESLTETRTALLDAAVALRRPGAKAQADAFCRDENVTVREAGAKALRALGDVKATCAKPVVTNAARELDETNDDAVLTLETDSGSLSITFDLGLAPVASHRLLDLAKAGFYDGVVIHRVVPGFVVQLGDPGGDGYGGADRLLRCETSPVPFGPLDVGVALAGRDTGSSQLFVTLARFPHLDGDYARIGHATGDWAAVAEGDVVRSAKVSGGGKVLGASGD